MDSAFTTSFVVLEPITCSLHLRRDLPPSFRGKIYDDHGKSMKNKIEMFKPYKFVLAFENNNVTDYVTEKMMCALQAGAVPVYMGAPNVDEWTPGENSIIRVDDFKDVQVRFQHLDRF